MERETFKSQIASVFSVLIETMKIWKPSFWVLATTSIDPSWLEMFLIPVSSLLFNEGKACESLLQSKFSLLLSNSQCF